MSIRLKDTIYDIINNSDKLDGYHRNNLYVSIPDWISSTTGLSKGITVEGDSDKFYPVVIDVSLSKEMPTFISIHKNLGTKTPSLSGNHSNGTSSLWLRYEMRNTMWDGNGGYIKTWYKYQGYATLVAHTRTNTKGHGGLIVWLRGGSCSYTVSCTNSFNVNIYYSSTNIGSSEHPDNVAPITSVDNGGIYTSTTLGYGNISGNASTATKLANSRTISLTGSVTGSGSFDGSGNLSISTTTNHTHEYASTVKVGSTSYNSSSNIISLPAYPTVPTTLKCPKSLTIKLNGTSQGAWDGSADKTIDITYSNVGAASSGHNHDSVYAPKSHTHTKLNNYYSSRPTSINPGVTGDGTMFHFKCTSSVTDTTTDPGDGHILHFNWDNTGGYDSQLFLPTSSSALKVRGMNGGTWKTWATVLTSDNWGTYCAAASHTHSYLPLTGGTIKNGTTSGPLDIDTTSTVEVGMRFKMSGTAKSWVGYHPTHGSIFYNYASGKYAGINDSGKLHVSGTEVSMSGHTHNYAGSSSAGGAATSANKLNTNAGGATTPVYFTGGVPTACSVASGDATASTIAVRNSSGDIYARLIRQTYADQSTISGGIVYRVNNSSDNYLRVCNSASAIRSFLGVPSTSDLGAYLPRRRMTNPDPGHANVGAIPLILALKAAGTPLYVDPEFKDGVNNCYVYNNSGNGTVTVTQITDNQNSGNSSGKILQISTSASTASPGRGGFVQNMSARAGAVFCQIFRAKIPTGYTLNNAENSMGSSYKTYWMTDRAGTGKWEWYCRITSCGTSGTMSSGGHVYISADAGGTAAVTWYLSYCNVIDLTKGNYDGLRAIYSDTATKLGSNAGSATNPVYFTGGKPTACTYSLNKTVPSDAKFTDTTYSAGSGLSLSGTTFNHASTVTAGTAGTSSATSGSTLAVPYVTVNATGHVTGYGTHTHTISGFAASSHTHSYAGSSSAGGAATSANKLNTNAGDRRSPVYFSGGVPVTCDYLNIKRYYTIDASSLSTSNFYPVTFASSDIMTDCEIHSPNQSGTAAYNQNMIHFQLIAQGWSDTPKSFKILHHGVYSSTEITIGAIGSGNEGGMQCVWVRGGMSYRFYCNKTPTLRTANTSNGNEIFTVGTGYSGGTNTKVTVHWKYGETSQIVCTAGHTHSYAAASHTHSSILDSGNSTATTFAYSKAGMDYAGYTWLAGWNGYELRAVNKSQFAQASHTHSYAGSSSAGGDANNSVKWGGYKIVVGSTGTATDTIYFVT